MSIKHANPYREGSNYHRVFDYLKKKQVVTKSELVKVNDDKKTNPIHDVNVILSPRHEAQTRKGADPRGSYSSKGHIYYVEKLKSKKVKGVKEEQKYRLRWRATNSNYSEPRIRPINHKIDSEKVPVVAKVDKVANIANATEEAVNV